MTTENKFIIEDNVLMQEWNWDENNELGLNPNALTFGSNKKAWWKCEKNHDWFVAIDRKVKRKNCPYCSNRRILSGYNDLATLSPNLLEEWNYEKNKGINPNELSVNSEIKVNWKCKSCNNEYQATIGSRSSGTACKKCGMERFFLSNIKSVEMIDIKTNKVIKIFKSISDASRETKINTSNITMVCKGIRKYAGGYIWKYTKKD